MNAVIALSQRYMEWVCPIATIIIRKDYYYYHQLFIEHRKEINDNTDSCKLHK